MGRGGTGRPELVRQPVRIGAALCGERVTLKFLPLFRERVTPEHQSFSYATPCNLKVVNFD